MCNFFWSYQQSSINPCLASLSDGLIAYYKLQETSGDVIDSIGGFNLTNNGVTRGQAGKLGNCYYFTGSTSVYCEGATPMAGLVEWTISCWVKMDRFFIAQQGIVSGVSNHPKISPYLAQVSGSSSAKLGKGYSNNTGNGLASITASAQNLDEWYLLTQRASINPSTGVLSYKGSINNYHEPTYGASSISGLTDIGGTLMFGKRSSLAFMGWLEDVKIWNRQLSDCEVNANYNEGNGIEL